MRGFVNRTVLRTWLRRVVLAVISVVFFTGLIDLWVSRSTKGQMYDDLALLPHHKVGLLLGTAKFLSGGWPNPYYRYRIEAAAALYRAGKVDYILASGDNGHTYYNEPETMQADLVAAGVPLNRIVLDYAGFRTLDSILRCRDVFGETEITVISQPFHNARALFIANRRGMQAVAFNARDVSAQWGLRVQLREKFARVKMLLDLMLGKEPKFYGPRIPIG